MGAQCTLVSNNILESGTVTITGGATYGSYPEARLYDWSKNLLWKSDATDGDDYEIGPMGGDDYQLGPMGGDDYKIGPEAGSDYVIQISQSAIEAVDTLFIENHNLGGHSMAWQYSDDGSAWTDAVPAWLQEGSGYIVKTLAAALSKAYWRIKFNAMQGDVTAGEIVLGAGRSFGIQARPSPVHQPRDNVLWSRSVGGQERGIKLGDVRRVRSYTLRLDSSGLDDMQAVFSDLSGFSVPLLFKDKDGEWFLARFDPPPSEDYFNKAATEIDISVVEML